MDASKHLGHRGRGLSCAGVAVIAAALLSATAACTESGNRALPGQGLGSANGENVSAAMACAPPATNEPRDLVCSRWACAHAELAAAEWDGDSKQCSAGKMDSRARESALHLINAYRYLAGVPELEPEPKWDDPAQDCALLAHANQQLSHYPPPEWSCWSERGARASAVSLVANRSAPLAIDPFIEDPGNEPTMVHRRWLLSEKIHRLGLGSTSRFSCALVDGREWDGPIADEPSGTVVPQNVGGELRAQDPLPTWVAWPPAGPVPIDVFQRTKLDTMGWTIQSSSLDLDGAAVEVRVAGAVKPVKVSPLERTLGSLTALRFQPDGWSTEPGTVYDVRVRKGGIDIAFAVEPVDCP